jgi:hypothetical protein
MQATLTPTPSAPTGLLGKPTGELVLQICGGEHDGRVLRLTAAKCTIGSAPGCTLRLRARGIRPVHALILRGPHGAIVRCWSPDTQLNERGFSEALLELGDKIQIGPIMLSVAELARPVPSPRTLVTRSEDEQTPSAPQPPAPRRVNRRRRKQLFGFLRQERQQQTNLQKALDTQREQLHAYEQQVEQLRVAAEAAIEQQVPEQPPVADCLSQQLSKTIEQLRQELDASAKRRAMEQQTFARQRAAFEEQAEQRLQAEVTQLREEIAAQQLAQAKLVNKEKLAEIERQAATLAEQRVTLTREVESLKLALETKAKSEELSRQSTASQIEQLSQAYELIRQERDELFDRLHTEQQTFDGQSHNLQAQVDAARRNAQAQIAEVQTAAQVQISNLRAEFAKREQQFDEELIARTSSEGLRSAADAERIHKLSAELEALRAEVKASTSGSAQQQEGFTQARKRLEAEIAALNSRLQQSEQAVHEARENSGQLQAAVLAEAEQARAQRDSVREQMLRQQQDWTEFRSRLELAANEERELARLRAEGLEAELKTCTQQRNAAKAECESLQDRLTKLEIEIEQSQESLLAAEHGANQRLQQMTISMEHLQLERGGNQSQLEQERAEWDLERNSLAQCVTDLQSEVSRLVDELQSAQREKTAADNAQLQVAQAQLTQWQTTAEEARQQAADLSQAVAKFRQQEQVWQLEREQLDHQQQSSNERLQQLESSITDLQQQLDEAQRAVAVTCPPPGTNVPATSAPQQPEFGSTINVNNQDLAALCEQMNESAPNLLSPRNIDVLDPSQLFAFQSREAALQEQADELAEKQAQLEEEQAIVARQRIELEQFQASLFELEHSLTQRAEELLHPPALPDPNASNVHPDFHDHAYNEGAERESNPLSESEAFAAMADQVAALASPSEPSSIVHSPADAAEFSYDSPATFSSPEDLVESSIQEQVIAAMAQAANDRLSENLVAENSVVDEAVDQDVLENIIENSTLLPSEELAGECLGISLLPGVAELSYDVPEVSLAAEPEISAELNAAEMMSAEPEPKSTAVIEPSAEEDFDRQLEARIARVMRRERTDWNTPATDESAVAVASDSAEAAAITPPPTQSQAVNSVLDRLKEAGLWKGEGTAKADQLPSSNHPLDEAGTGLCRSSQVGPIGSDVVEEAETSDEADAPLELEEDDLSLLARPSAAKPSLLNTPAKDDDSDDSIESYMSRLMQRLRTSDDEDPSPRKTGATNRASSNSTAKAAAPSPPPAPKPTDSKPLTSLSELSPRSPAPEQSANLAAMRELANSAARGAIETHRTRNKQERVNMRTVNTLMAVLVAAGFTFMWSRTGSMLALGGISLSLLWAISSSLLAASQSLMLRQAKGKANKAEQAAEEAPPQQ